MINVKTFGRQLYLSIRSRKEDLEDDAGIARTIRVLILKCRWPVDCTPPLCWQPVSRGASVQTRAVNESSYLAAEAFSRPVFDRHHRHAEFEYQ